MNRRMFGVESEYAITGAAGKKILRREQLVGDFLKEARSLVHLQDAATSTGIFLENGARFYIDCGLHPEMSTPECTDPWELARYIKAGERILEGVTQRVQARYGGSAEIMCFRANVDYSGTGSTWGCHESYLHRADPSLLPDQLIPHLVTRVIYTGAGGFNPLVSGLEFSLAPRLMHIQQVISGDSTGNRGIFHTKNESLATNGYHRLHILCGENLCSETAIVLKLGATALVVALAEAGLKPGARVQLAAPLEALRAVASDPSCKREICLAVGDQITALGIQRYYLQQAERHPDLLPPWAGQMCALWRSTLDRLEEGQHSVSTVLDWAIKHRLFRDRAARRGVPIDRMSHIDANNSPWFTARNEFCQIDTRFSQLGPRGIFGEMDRRRVLDHHLHGVHSIEQAMRDPPSVGRAKLRGEAVRSLFGQAPSLCDWCNVIGSDGRYLDLGDPFTDHQPWSTVPAGADPENIGELPFDLETNTDYHRLVERLGIIRRRYGRRPRSETQSSAERTQSSSQ